MTSESGNSKIKSVTEYDETNSNILRGNKDSTETISCG
jgi:hypothetical protein